MAFRVRWVLCFIIHGSFWLRGESLNISHQNRLGWVTHIRGLHQPWCVSKGEAAGGSWAAAVRLEVQGPPLESQPAVAARMLCCGKRTHRLTSPRAVCRQTDLQLTEDESSGSHKKGWTQCPVQGCQRNSTQKWHLGYIMATEHHDKRFSSIFFSSLCSHQILLT